jgi:hypothetical protein
MRQATALRQGFLAATTEEAAHFGPFCPRLGQTQLLGALARDDDEVDSVGQEVWPRPEALAADAANPVSKGSDAHLTRDDEAEARRPGRAVLRGGSRGYEEHEMGRGYATCKILHARELTPLADTSVATEAAAPGAGHFL